MLTPQQQKDLALVHSETARLANKSKFTKQDEVRFGFLKMAQVAIREEGMTLDELEHGDLHERARSAGVETLPTSYIPRDVEQRNRAWKAFIDTRLSESRDMTEGAPMISHIGSYTGLGYFVPTGFFPTLFAALAQHDCLFNAEDVTLIKTTDGNPITVPTIGDIENIATVVGEAGQVTSTDLSAPGQAKLGTYKYMTWDAISIESFQDVYSPVSVFSQNFASRFARGIGKDLVTGSGTSKTLGLIPSLIAAGVTQISAAGSAANDGSGNTGINSIGSEDFQAAFNALDDAYANSPKCAWVMNKKTLATVSGQLDKYGNILRLVEWSNGKAYIFGIPVKIAPSMDNIGNGKNPVVLMDLSYWATRIATAEDTGLQVIKESAGLVEYGKVGLRAYVRADGCLLYNDSNSPAPAVIIQNIT
jgi:HK97 family phage major capsid protein